MTDETQDTGTDHARHPGGDPVTLRLTAQQADVIHHFIMENHEREDTHYQPVLDVILDQLPEHDILTRPPSAETAIEMGLLDVEPDPFDCPTIVGDSDV